jgi:hypothetical protein
MNWVEHRARCDQYLGNSQEVWSQVRSAVQEACKSYARHYGHAGVYELQCSMEQDNWMVIERTLPPDKIFRSGIERRRVLVTFSDELLTIEVACNFVGQNTKLYISSDEDGAFVVMEGIRLSSEEVSRRILEGLLFPPDERRHPI